MTFDRQNFIPTPSEYLGFEVGEDRKLAGWEQITGYFNLLDGASDRLQVVDIGRSTEDNPVLMAVISSAENLARLEEYRRIQQCLADPRRISYDAESERLIADGKVVVAITCSIHATEVGATQMSLLLAHHLSAHDSEEVRQILDNVVLLLIPSLNPDGLIKVKSWYESTLGTTYEGVMPPFLYHKYTGHDNNRDWFMFTQQETRLLVEHCLNTWHPHILLDMHQTRSNGVRMILPPFVDPVGPNVDPILQSEIAMLGAAIAADMTAEGKSGVAVNVVYDAYNPNRTYPHYHGGVRLLSEAAGVRIATPVDIRTRDLQSDRGETPTQRTWNHPLPWQAGKWSLRDIVEYDFAVAVSCVSHAARLRKVLLRNFHQVGKNALANASAPYAFVVPPQQHDSHAAAELLSVLRTGLVEIHEVADAFRADGNIFPEGSHVILRGQPYWAYAKTLMQQQQYPDVREYVGAPPKVPYDVTAHCLPMQMGVNTYTINEEFTANLRLIDDKRTANFVAAKASDRRRHLEKSDTYIIPSESNAAAHLVNRLLSEGVSVERITEPLSVDGNSYGRGAFVVRNASEIMDDFVGDDALLLNAATSLPSMPHYLLRKPNIGIYNSHIPSTEEGWTRFVFDEYGFDYTSLSDADVRQGNLGERFDAIVMPHQRVRQIHNGHSASYYHPDYSGGLGDKGAECLREFVEQGGTLVTWDGASRYAIRHMDLPVRNVLVGLSRSDFYAPGSLLAMLLDTAHPIAYGMPSLTAVMFYDSPAFDIRQGRVIGKYPLRNPLFSGMLIGAERLFNRTALATVSLGKGEVVLMGFRPHFRAQARCTYKILFNSLYSSAGAYMGCD